MPHDNVILDEYEHLKTLIAHYKKHPRGQGYYYQAELHAAYVYSYVCCEMMEEDADNLLYPLAFSDEMFIEAVTSLFETIFKQHVLSRINIFLDNEYHFTAQPFTLEQYSNHHGHLQSTWMIYQALNHFFVEEMQLYLEPVSLKLSLDSNELMSQELRLVRNYTPLNNAQLMHVHGQPLLSPDEVLP